MNLKNKKEITKDVHNISGLIITTLQDLPEPIITWSLYDKFVKTDSRPFYF
jgi:hypothetical protein